MAFIRRLKPGDWLNIMAILLIIGLFAWVAREYGRAFGSFGGGGVLTVAQNLRLFILSYGRWGLAVMIGLHALHVIITVIPSGLVQFAGGFVYGMGLGMLSGFIGITLGTAVSFYLSRLLGRRAAALFVSEKNIRKLDSIAASPRTSLGFLLMFILPVPKDFLAYLVGLTSMRARRFFLISALGRLPGMFVATYVGAHLLERNYLFLGLVTAACAMVSLLAYIYRGKILALSMKK
jgi:uncharacterized membrane protein YdjX (TVP38/TMEM64 family)